MAPFVFTRLDRFASRERVEFSRNGGGETNVRTDTTSSTNDININMNDSGENGDNNMRNSFLKRLSIKIIKSKNILLLWITKFHLKIHKLHRFSCRKFGQFYPILKGFYKILIFSSKFAYLLGRTKHVNPVLNILGIALVKNNNKIQNETMINGDFNKSKDLTNSFSLNGNSMSSPSSFNNISNNIINTNNISNNFSNINTNATGTIDNLGNIKKSFDFSSIESKSAVFVSILISFRIIEMLLRSERNRSSSILSNSMNSVYNYFMPNNSNTVNTNNNNESNNNDNNSSNNYNNNNSNVHAKPSIPPIPQQLKVGRGCIIPPNSNNCPICRKKRINPCAASSGYVFCYLCLFNSVQLSPFCPVSGISCTESEILRLYEENY